MRKQKTKKLFAKAFIAVFIINTICIFGFSGSSLAAQNLSVSASPSTYFMDDDNPIRISWYAPSKPSEGLVSWGGYYSYVYKSLDNGAWQYLGWIAGTGYKTYYYHPDVMGDYRFRVIEICTKIYFPYGQSSTYIVVGDGISNNVEVNGPPSDYNLDGTILFGATDRKFPTYDDSKIEFIIGTLDSINNINPEISFQIQQTIDLGAVTRVNLKVDDNPLPEEPDILLKPGDTCTRTIPTEILSIEGTHIITIEVLDIRDDTIHDNDKYELNYLKVANLNFIDCNGTFTFDYDSPGSEPSGWTSNHATVIEVEQANLQNYDNGGNLIRLSNYDDYMKRDMNVAGVSDKILYMNFDIYIEQFEEYNFQILFKDDTTVVPRFIIFVEWYGAFGIKEGMYGINQEREIITMLSEKKMYNIELIFSFIDIDNSRDSVVFQAYVDGVFQGIYDILIPSWYSMSDEINEIELGNVGLNEIYLDNLYYDIMKTEGRSSEEYVDFPIPITYIEPPEIPYVQTSMKYYYRSETKSPLDLTLLIPVFPLNDYVNFFVPITSTVGTWDEDHNKVEQLFLEAESFYYVDEDDPLTINDTVIVYYKVTGFANIVKIMFPGTDNIIRTILSDFREGNSVIASNSIKFFLEKYGYLGDHPDDYGPNLEWEENPPGEFVYNYSDNHDGEPCPRPTIIDMVGGIGNEVLQDEFRLIEYESNEWTVFELNFFGLFSLDLSYSFSEITVYYHEINGLFSPELQEFRFSVLQPVYYYHPWGIHQIRVVPPNSTINL